MEIKQTLERSYDMVFGLKEIRQLTFEKLKQLGEFELHFSESDTNGTANVNAGGVTESLRAGNVNSDVLGAELQKSIRPSSDEGVRRFETTNYVRCARLRRFRRIQSHRWQAALMSPSGDCNARPTRRWTRFKI